MKRASEEMRARDPAFAAMVDMCVSLTGIIDSYRVLLEMERERSARFQADIATLNARLSAKEAA